MGRKNSLAKEIDYRIRELYESELRRTKTSSKGLEYLKTLDRIKQFDIRKEMETLSGRNKERLKYEGQRLKMSSFFKSVVYFKKR